MKSINLTYKKRKLEVRYIQSQKGKITIETIKMSETGEDITNIVDSDNKKRISNMIKINQAQWV